MSLKHAASSYKKHNARLTEQIVAKVRGNPELQTLLLDFIGTYETAALQAQEKGETVAQTMMAKSKQPVLDLTRPEHKPVMAAMAVGLNEHPKGGKARLKNNNLSDSTTAASSNDSGANGEEAPP